MPLLFIVLVAAPNPKEALSYGKGACGKLEGGTALPCQGENYEMFAKTACALGRNFLHPLVIQTIEEAYTLLQKTDPDRVWQVGDLGWKEGGSFKPHKTHQNGLSADFFVPVQNTKGAPSKVPISVFNKFGYDVEFDANGSYKDLDIDWPALARHLVALDNAGTKRGVAVELVILDPKLRKIFLQHAPRARLFASRFSKKRAWVRHDEHYHVNFSIPKRLRRKLVCR